jgi:hypothetical protein
MEIVKVCKKCKVSKPDNRFYRNEKTCKDCRNAAQREWTRKNKDKVAAYCKNWRKNNPESAHASESKAKARRKDALKETIIDLTADDWTKTLAYFGNKCAVCDEDDGIHIDHFVPVASGNGDTSVTNVIPLCAFHNVSKSDKHPINWLRNESGANPDVVERVIDYLASVNGMTSQEYEDFAADRFFGIDSEFDNDIEYVRHVDDISLYDADNFIYDDDDWYLIMLNGRRG